MVTNRSDVGQPHHHSPPHYVHYTQSTHHILYTPVHFMESFQSFLHVAAQTNLLNPGLESRIAGTLWGQRKEATWHAFSAFTRRSTSWTCTAGSGRSPQSAGLACHAGRLQGAPRARPSVDLPRRLAPHLRRVHDACTRVSLGTCATW